MKRILITLCSLLFLLVTTTSASTIGYEFNIGGSGNIPTLTLENLSTTLNIVEFSITIGHTGYNYDTVGDQSGSAFDSFSLDFGDDSNGGNRTDSLLFSFSGFDPGEIFSFITDIDIDSDNSVENYYSVLFNNGDLVDNALISVTFSDTTELSDYLSDGINGPNKLTQTITMGTSSVPEPTTMLLFSLGLLGFAGVNRKK